MQFRFYSFIGGVAKKKIAQLRHLILLSRVTYWAPVGMLFRNESVCEMALTLRNFLKKNSNY
jgi:hypothetical protein